MRRQGGKKKGGLVGGERVGEGVEVDDGGGEQRLDQHCRWEAGEVHLGHSGEVIMKNY